MKTFSLITALTVAAFTIASCDKDYSDENKEPEIQSTVVKDDGNNLDASLAQLRSLLGDQLNTTPDQTAGRREVNWDGVAVTFTNNEDFPADFFNNTAQDGPNGRKRGIVYNITANTKFRVDSSAFEEIDPSYAQTFQPFSTKKLISPVGSNVSEVSFRVPGKNTIASVKGFGLIFSDVDYDNSTTVEYFEENKSLGVFKVPASKNASGFSLLGVYFANASVTKVRIITGNAALQYGVKDVSSGGDKDLVVMDDFFFSEPQAY